MGHSRLYKFSYAKSNVLFFYLCNNVFYPICFNQIRFKKKFYALHKKKEIIPQHDSLIVGLLYNSIARINALVISLTTNW